jgi:hypothetical protein
LGSVQISMHSLWNCWAVKIGAGLVKDFSSQLYEIQVNRDLHCVWNVMAQVQKPDFVFRRKGRVHLNRRGCQFSRLLAAEVCASTVVMVVMLDTPCSEVVWRVLAFHSIRQFPLHFPSRASTCDVTFQLYHRTLRYNKVTDVMSKFYEAFGDLASLMIQKGCGSVVSQQQR